jgi:hypothetical protein
MAESGGKNERIVVVMGRKINGNDGECTCSVTVATVAAAETAITVMVTSSTTYDVSTLSS